MRAVPLLLLFLGGAPSSQAQFTDDVRPSQGAASILHDELTLHTGYTQGIFGLVELGIGRSLYSNRHVPVGAGYYAGVEFRPDRPEVMGVKVGAYMNGFKSLGVQLIRYTGPEGGTVFRPEVGVGALKGKVTYAYNIGISSVMVPGVNTHMVSFTYDLRMLRLPRDETRRMKR